MVAPREAEVEEELTQSLEFDQVRLALLVGACGLPLDVDFPVLKGRLLRRSSLKVKDE